MWRDKRLDCPKVPTGAASSKDADSSTEALPVVGAAEEAAGRGPMTERVQLADGADAAVDRPGNHRNLASYSTKFQQGRTDEPWGDWPVDRSPDVREVVKPRDVATHQGPPTEKNLYAARTKEQVTRRCLQRCQSCPPPNEELILPRRN